MKNKEIEEILNYMKQYVENIYEHDSEPMLNYKDLQIILSYIEQLKKHNYDLDKENQMLFESNLKLENNRDKAIEYIETGRDGDYCDALSAIGLLNILKGDSDE